MPIWEYRRRQRWRWFCDSISLGENFTTVFLLFAFKDILCFILLFFETLYGNWKNWFFTSLFNCCLYYPLSAMQASFVRNYRATTAARCSARYCSSFNFDINVRARVIIYATGEKYIFALAYGVMCEIYKCASFMRF